MRSLYDGDTFSIDGINFQVRIENDDSMGAPWVENDGHGSIRAAISIFGRVDKKPGEVVIHSERQTHWLYDFAGAMQTARKEWGITAEESAKLTQKLGRAPTAGEIAQCAVLADMKFCAGFLSGGWCWVGVTVNLVSTDGEVLETVDSLWGIESEGDYSTTVALEMGAQYVHARREAWRSALKAARKQKAANIAEAAEAQYWACRDVETVGV